MSLRSTVRKTLEAVLPASAYNQIHAMITKKRAQEWVTHPEQYILDVLNAHVAVGGVTMDVGANLGQWSIHMSKRVGPNGIVHAFEPVPNFMTVFKKTMREFKADANIRFHELAIGDKKGEITFVTHNEKGEYLSGEAHIGKPGEKGNITVPVVTLDSLLDSMERIREVRFIKVDVEGAELMLLKGGTRFMKELRPVIFSEVEDRHCKGFGHTRQDVIDFMTTQGYDHKAITHNDVLFTPR